ncbi:MAG TPA: AAA family ATPase [Vicinamibacterales bacterium]|nr:AAA family ATPase [Vicinamibacterales bacterium]
MKYFRPFLFDDSSRTLWRSRASIAITRKAGDLLAYFLEHPATPQSHAQIMAHVWPDTHVQLQNIKALVHELRGALDDRATPSRFIRADPGRGYTFVADVTEAPVPFSDGDDDPAPPVLAGREDELALLRRALGAAVVGAQPQLVVIDGERGWGKTALCRTLARIANAEFGARVSVGQALDMRGRVEAYAVLGDAVDLLMRQYPHAVGPAIEAHAPTWKRRSRLPEAGPHARRGNSFSTAAQVGREITHVFEDLAQNVPLLLMFEDMQWSDVTTLEWLTAMAHRAAPSRLMMVVTCCRGEQRAVGLIDRLAHDLTSEQWGHVLRLRPLTDVEVARYVEMRFGCGVSRVLAAPLAGATGGHPMLIASTLETLIGMNRMFVTPDGWQLTPGAESIDDVLLAGLIGGLQSQIDHLSVAERRVLEAAARVGVQFTPESIATVLPGAAADVVDRRLAEFAERRLFVTPASVSSGPGGPHEYRFRHPVAADLLRASAEPWMRSRLARFKQPIAG